MKHELVDFIQCGKKVDLNKVHIGMTYKQIKDIFPNAASSESQISYHRSYEQWEKPHTSLNHDNSAAEYIPDTNSYDNSP